jgi:tetratricopeptide (TPR) repeat protein
MPDRLEQLLQFYEDDPDDAFTRFALAREYLKRGETQKALSFFEELREDDPEYVGTYYHLGKLYEKLDRPDDAEATYEAGIGQAEKQRDQHARSELQDALLEVQGVGLE